MIYLSGKWTGALADARHVPGAHALSPLAEAKQGRRNRGAALGSASAGADKDRIKSHFLNHVFNSEETANQNIAFNLHAKFGEVFHLRIDYIIG